MNDINKTIKHFESLQKRYTTQHNGKMCERVADALEALEYFKEQGISMCPKVKNLKIQTQTKLIIDNKKYFFVGDDISFTLFNKETNHHDHYIGNIINITDTFIKISNIEINRCHEDGEMIIRLEDFEPNSCNYVYSN